MQRVVGVAARAYATKSKGSSSSVKSARPANPMPHTSSITPSKESQRSQKRHDDSQTLSPAEKAKALMLGRISGTFTTVSFEGKTEMPLFGSLMPYVLHQRWQSHPIIAVRTDENHYENIKNVAKSAFTIFPLTPKAISPSSLPLSRINITGDAKPITDEADIKLVEERYAQVHPGSEKFIADRETFKLFEFAPSDVHFMRSTGELEVIAAQDFERAKDDPIAPHSRKMIEKINADYPNEICDIIKEFGEIDVAEAFIFATDRLGFDIMGRERESGNWMEFRLPWPYPITDVGEYESHLRQTAIDAQNKRKKSAAKSEE